MSSLLVTVTTISKVREHPNADKLDVAEVKGWQVVTRKGEFTEGDRVVYFPPDTVLPQEVSDEFGVTQYLSKGRIRCAKLRGEPSFGVVVKAPEGFELDQDVADKYGATKYVQPLRPTSGDQAPDHGLFVKYTEIENMRNFPAILEEGEEVVVTEKIHGTNCRVGTILVEGAPIEEDKAVVMAGTHQTRRQCPETEEERARHIYWYPTTLDSVKSLLAELSKKFKQVILFGEVYGKVQSLKYGVKGLAFRAFDLMLDGSYVSYNEFAVLMTHYRVPRVPVSYRGPFSLAKIKELSDGKSLMPGADHIREGVVVKPVKERTDPRTGRVILKYLGDSYLLGKHTDYEDV